MTNKKGVMVYGEFIGLVLSSLNKQGINLFPFAYSALEDDVLNNIYGKKPVSVVSSSKLTTSFLIKEFRNSISHIIVTLSGKVLEQDIHFLLRFKIPLIICSKDYDEILVTDAVHHARVPVILSEHNINENGFCLKCMKYLDQVNSGAHTKADIVEMLAV